MNIFDKSAIRECTSCQMCAAVCPHNALNININIDGFYHPVITHSLCVDCGMCVKICYKFDRNIEPFGKEKLRSTKLYGAAAKQDDVVESTTSGGIADLLARELIHDGYKCIGVVYDSEKDCAKHIVATSENETIGFRGSKYIQSYTLDAFKEIVKKCKDEKYAIFGTPCQIYALDRYLKQRHIRDRHILIDLYCHGCPTINVWKKYINKIKLKINKEKIDYVNFRSKVKGWGNFYVLEVAVDGKSLFYSDVKKNEFFDIFFSDQVLNKACEDCMLRSTLAYTDIRLGDFWGKQYVLNYRGVSAISLVTDKAKCLFDKIQDRIDYQEQKYEDFLTWQSWGKKYQSDIDLRKTLLGQLLDNRISLRESIETIHNSQTFKSKILRYAKNLVHLLPINLERRIRWMYYQFTDFSLSKI